MTNKERQVTKTITLSIRSHRDIDLNSSLWAVNWFNPKSTTLYKLYTLLAGPLVLKVGGGLCFKGSFEELLYGPKELKRNMLLVVKYPSATKFLELASYKYFQVLSLLRTKAVRNFVFGFTKRSVAPQKKIKRLPKGSSSLVLLMTKEVSDKKEWMDTLARRAHELGIGILFAGDKAASLTRIESGKKEKTIPFFIEIVVILESDNRDKMRHFIDDPCFDTLKAEDSFLAVLMKKL